MSSWRPAAGLGWGLGKGPPPARAAFATRLATRSPARFPHETGLALLNSFGRRPESGPQEGVWLSRGPSSGAGRAPPRRARFRQHQSFCGPPLSPGAITDRLRFESPSVAGARGSARCCRRPANCCRQLPRTRAILQGCRPRAAARNGATAHRRLRQKGSVAPSKWRATRGSAISPAGSAHGSPPPWPRVSSLRSLSALGCRNRLRTSRR